MTRLQNLNAYLTERLMVAAREILEVVGNTISEYQKETARTIKENEELRRRLREIGVQANLEFLDSGHPVAPPVSIGTTPQGQQPHERQCNSGQGEDREPQQTDIKQEFPEQHESNPEQGVVDLNKQASALTCAENPSEHRILQTSLPFEEKTEEVGCLPHMLPDQIKSEPDELDYSIQKQSIASQPLNRVNNNSSTAESTNCAERNWMDHGGVMPEPNEQDSSREMDCKMFYGARPRNFLALIPENPQDSDVDLSDEDDDQTDDPDYQPTQGEDTGDTSFESMDEEEIEPTSSYSKPPPHKKRRKGKNTPKTMIDEEEIKSTISSSKPPPHKKSGKGKNTLKTVSMVEPEDPSEPPGPNKVTRRIWKYEDIEEFQVPDSRFEAPDAVKTPFQYFKTLFTDEMIEHIVQHTNLYSAQELGDPIKTSPVEIESFLAILIFMGVFSYPAMEDYWHHESRFNMIADIMPRKRFKLLRRFIHFNDNYKFNNSPDRFYKIRPLFEMLREQCLLIPSTYKHSVDEVMVAYKGKRAGTLRQYIARQVGL